ncbi:hypothetical protein HZA39_03675 [Candidatus Peregrinibacteria bacterium]|nr:hypothetical protein [Candidatus Peregrinibacteria bacterium]
MSQKTSERRIDPENLMGIDWHAPRALLRPEFQGLESAEARRAAISKPETTFREGDVMRRAIFRALDRIEGVRTPEQQKLLDSLMSQREQAADTWTKQYDLTRLLKQVPSKEELMAGC